MNSMVSINVLVITYNQEDVIGRALDSILCQKDWGLKEIVICDDYSTDKNWEVIQSYVEKYPEIIRAYRNDPNLGIIGNVQKTYELRGKADLFVQLSGDDTFNDGYFREVQNLVKNSNIDVKNEAAILMFDYQERLTNGKTITFSNKRVKRSKDLSRLKYRFLVSNRSSLVTEKVMKKYKNVRLDLGVTYAEEACERQSFNNSDKAYYCPFPGNVYFAGLGVSTKMHNEYHRQKRLEKWQLFLKEFSLCPKDVFYTKMRIHIAKYEIKPSISEFCKIIYYFFKSLDIRLGISPLQFILVTRMIITRPFKKN